LFGNNSATNGGALLCSGNSTAELHLIDFLNNTAAMNGGGVLSGDTSKVRQVVNFDQHLISGQALQFTPNSRRIANTVQPIPLLRSFIKGGSYHMDASKVIGPTEGVKQQDTFVRNQSPRRFAFAASGCNHSTCA
jgi:predicted outer membrane repeat protein